MGCFSCPFRCASWTIGQETPGDAHTWNANLDFHIIGACWVGMILKMGRFVKKEHNHEASVSNKIPLSIPMQWKFFVHWQICAHNSNSLVNLFCKNKVLGHQVATNLHPCLYICACDVRSCNYAPLSLQTSFWSRGAFQKRILALNSNSS